MLESEWWINAPDWLKEAIRSKPLMQEQPEVRKESLSDITTVRIRNYAIKQVDWKNMSAIMDLLQQTNNNLWEEVAFFWDVIVWWSSGKTIVDRLCYIVLTTSLLHYYCWFALEFMNSFEQMTESQNQVYSIISWTYHASLIQLPIYMWIFARYDKEFQKYLWHHIDNLYDDTKIVFDELYTNSFNK